eukprot:EG_transcript_9290
MITEILCEVFEFVDAIGLFQCKRVCRGWCKVIEQQLGRPFKHILRDWGLYALGGHGYTGLSTVIRYRPGDKHWVYGPAMPQPRCHFATVVCNRKIYVFGGRYEDERLKSAICYDPMSQAWINLPPMRTVRSAAVAAAYGTNVYVFGGFDGEHEVSSVERFDTELQQWFYDVPGLPTPLSDAAAVSLRHDIFVIGGARNCGEPSEEVLNTCWKYSPRENRWTQMASMAVSRMFPAVAALDNLIYVTAGVTPSEEGWKQANIRLMFVNSTEIFDLQKNEWRAGPPLCTQRQNPTAATFLDSIYVVGGHCGDPLDSVEKLPHERDAKETGHWFSSVPMPDKRDACRAIALL